MLQEGCGRGFSRSLEIGRMKIGLILVILGVFLVAAKYLPRGLPTEIDYSLTKRSVALNDRIESLRKTSDQYYQETNEESLRIIATELAYIHGESEAVHLLAIPQKRSWSLYLLLGGPLIVIGLLSCSYALGKSAGKGGQDGDK